MNCKTGKKVVLMYHRVNDTTQDYNRITVNEKNFRAQMMFLKENYLVLSVDDFLAYEGREDVVTITFDDGFADFYQKALPILEETEIPATIFVTTGKMDTEEELWTSEIMRLLYLNDSGCEKLSLTVMGKQVFFPISTIEQRGKAYRSIRQILMQVSGAEVEELLADMRNQLDMDAMGRQEYLFLSHKQCKELAEHPLITVGAHTVSHVSVGKVEDTVMECEIQTSIEQLQNTLSEQIRYFAYPFGSKADYSLKAIEQLRKCGIKAAFTTCSGDYKKGIHSEYEIPRVYVGNWEVDRFQKSLEVHLGLEKVSGNQGVDKVDFYMGSLDDDIELWQSDSPIIIWGTGVRGRKIRERLVKAGAAERILAFADNNPDLWDAEIEGSEVWSEAKVVHHFDAAVIVHNAMDAKIVKQLIDMGIEKIHWIV